MSLRLGCGNSYVEGRNCFFARVSFGTFPPEHSVLTNRWNVRTVSSVGKRREIISRSRLVCRCLLTLRLFRLWSVPHLFVTFLLVKNYFKNLPLFELFPSRFSHLKGCQQSISINGFFTKLRFCDPFLSVNCIDEVLICIGIISSILILKHPQRNLALLHIFIMSMRLHCALDIYLFSVKPDFEPKIIYQKLYLNTREKQQIDSDCKT